MRNAFNNLRRIEHALSLAKHGSFVVASRELNITESALSRSIHTLEIDLKMPLFDRGKGGVRPTSRGVEFLEAAQILRSTADHLIDTLAGTHESSRSQVRFGLNPSLGGVVVPSLTHRVVTDLTLPRVQIITDRSQRLLELLTAGSIDFYVTARQTVGHSAHIDVEKVADLPVVMWASADHPLAHKLNIDYEDLAPYPTVGSNLDFSGRVNRDAESRHLIYDPIVAFDNFELLAQAIIGTEAVMPLFPFVELDGLVPLHMSDDFYPKSFEVALVQLKQSRPSAEVRRLIELIRCLVKAAPKPS